MVGEDDEFQLEHDLFDEQKEVNLSGSTIIYGPTASDGKQVNYELYLPDAKISDKYPDQAIHLPQDPDQHAAIIEKLPSLAEEAHGDSTKLYGLIVDAIAEIKTGSK